MASVQIDEAEFLRLQSLNAFANKIAAHPDAGVLLEQAAKIVEPTIKTPRIERAEAEKAPLKALEDKIEKLTQSLSEKETQTTVAQQMAALQKLKDEGIHALRTQHKYTDEGIAKIEQIMLTKGVSDPLDAAAIFERNNPPPTVAKPHLGSSWNFADANQNSGNEVADKALQALLQSRGEDEHALDQLTMVALSEARGQQVRP